ncbi:MAG: hypothetical protein ATN31_04980 [Candidatus Epulonipiscioides saccharophilum]|nr:MAG: hypothetical protein ATN31_04980 [Epulopiscium sp. AS2M-Bin001]
MLNFMSYMTIYLMIGLTMAPAIFMIVMVIKNLKNSSDSKQKQIVEKTCLYTLPLYTIVLIINTISALFGWSWGQTLNSHLTHILTIGILFLIVYIYVKIKMSDKK